MKYSKKTYLDYMLRTLDALHAPESQPHIFINNPGFGNIFDILKNESYATQYLTKLQDYFGETYADTIVRSLQKSSLNSFYTPVPVIASMATYLKNIETFQPVHILEPSAGNGLILRDLMRVYPKAKYTAFEKEILTARILEHNFKEKDNITVFGIPFESLQQTDAIKKYDLVISNIPFGANKIFDPTLTNHPLRSELTRNIHSYFIFKSLDSLKPSGISLLLCTKNFLDKRQYTTIRKDIILRNNFIGGVRLPDSTFAQENTSVVTDILVFQNNRGLQNSKEQAETNALFVETIDREIGNNTIQFSAYYDKNPNNVLGEIIEGGLYDQKDYTLKGESDITLLALQINKAMEGLAKPKIGMQIEKEVLKKQEVPIVEVAQELEKPEPVSKSKEHRLKEGNLDIYQQKIIKYGQDMQMEFLKVKPRDFDKLTKIISLRDTYFEVVNGPDEHKVRQQENLKYQYDMFVFQYGQLHHKNNYPFITLDIQGPLLLGLEVPKNGQFQRAEILIKPITEISKAKKEPDVQLNLQDAIYYSLNKFNRIDLDQMIASTRIPEDQLVRQALNEQLLFLEPTSNGLELAPKFQFLSGPISQKIDFYKKNDFGNFQTYVNKEYQDRTILELEKIKPPITPFEDLDVKIHEPWFSLKITQAFIYDAYKTYAHIAYNESTSKYMVKIQNYDYHQVKKFYVRSEHRSYHFKEILEGALNFTIPYVTKGSGDWKRTDKVKMQEIKLKFELLYKEFNTYIQNSPKLKTQLEETFYNTYDAYLHPKYDGKYLKFEGLQNFEPYQSQKDTVAGIVINQGLLVNKEVGFGKTLDMALTAQKLYELNLSKKTLVIGLRSTIVQLEKEFLNAFPKMNILVAHDKVVNGKTKREAFFKKIVDTQTQVVLMSHDTFKFIPHSPKVIKAIILEELENLERDLLVIHQDKYSINKKELKGLELRKENLEANLNQIYHQINTKQGSAFGFEKMGIDHIMVDESHMFKNLMYTTRHGRVAGLNTSTGSERSKNLLTAIRTLQQKRGRDFQTTFLSGTPISNSITEVYVLFKYLIPQRLQQMNITSFDQWAQVFANKSYEFEPTISGDYKVRERFRSFKKMKLLSSLYNEISIIVNGRTHPIDRPQMVLDVHSIKPTPGQLEYFEQIKEFLKTGNSDLLYGNKTYTEQQKGAMSLIALYHMRNASIDPRLLEPNLVFEERSKLWQIATQVYLTYNETNHFKGTQAIFSDLGVPKDTFNIYDELKRILTEEFDIPKEEVTFIHDFKTDAKRLQCFQDFNSGKYRVIVGSTQKLGTGTNIQERLCRIHHVDIPYRPTDVDQRNGRGVRKGNIGAKEHADNKVIVSFYVVENSTDALMLTNVNTKKNFIEQITNGTIQFNNLDMGPVNDKGTIDYKTLLAVAKNDPMFLEKEELAKELDELLLERNIFKKNHREAQSSINFYKAELDKTIKTIAKLENDLPLWNSISDIDVYFKELGTALDITQPISPKEIGQYLTDKLNKYRSTIGEHKVLNLKNAVLTLKVPNLDTHDLHVKTPNASYGYGSRKITINTNTIGEYIHKALAKIPTSLKMQKELLGEYEESISGSQKILDLKFDKEDQLLRVEQRLSEIHKWLDETYDKEPEDDKKNKNPDINKGKDKGESPEISPDL